MHLAAIVPLMALLEPALPSVHTMVFEQTCSHTDLTFTCEQLEKSARLTLGADRIWVLDEDGKQTRLRTVKDESVVVLEKPVSDSGTSMIHILTATGRFYWFEVTWSEKLKSDNVVVRGGRIR